MAGKPLIVILGPTAVGKTKLAISLCQALNGEIINADSRQIYKEMSIGTAKPTLEEQQQAKHHLIDLVYPDENLSLAQYQAHVYDTVKKLHDAQKVPLLVGGTGQYISAVIEGWSIPEVPPNEAFRQTLEAEAKQIGREAIHQRLTAIDPEAAQKIHPNNLRRVIRALEVYHETGKPITELQKKHPPPYRIKQYALTMEREPLYQRSDIRFDIMMEMGLLDEVSMLLQRGYATQLPAMSAIGYLQLAQYIQGKMSLDDAIETSKLLTHDFIRRQYTWFKKYNQNAEWLSAETLSIESIICNTQQWLNQSNPND